MFRTQNNVPEVYPDKSRDFQMFCRLFDAAFGSVKQSIDTMENITDTKTCDAVLLPLLKDKLGFFSDSSFSDTELRYILQAFPAIIRYKGSLQAILYIENLYSRLVSSVSSAAPVQINPFGGDYVIEISSEKAVVKTQLLFELLKYVLPAGYTIDYYVTEYHESVSQFYTQNSLIYSDGLFVQLLDSSIKNYVPLTGTTTNLYCEVDGTLQFLLPYDVDGGIPTQKFERDLPTHTLQFTADRNLVFYKGAERTHYLVAKEIDGDWKLCAVSVNDINKQSATKYSLTDGCYVFNTGSENRTIGLKRSVSKIVIRKDVDSDSKELSNIVNTTTIL